MRKLLNVFALVFILAGCTDLLNKPASSAEGRGVVTVNIGDSENSRTLLPGGFDNVYYVLTFTPQPAGESFDHKLGNGTSVETELIPGEWTVDVNGFLSGEDAEDKSNAVSTGSSEEFSVTSGGNVDITIKITPIVNKLTQNGGGILSFTITLPTRQADILT